MAGDRTERATPHRRQEARKQGDILHSRELSSAAGTLAGILMLGYWTKRLPSLWSGIYAGFLRLGSAGLGDSESIAKTLNDIRQLMITFLYPFATVMAAVAAGALGAGILQTGGVTFSAGAIGFKANRLNPLPNVKNLFSLRSAARLLKSLLPVSALVVVCTQRMMKQFRTPAFSTSRIQTMGADVYFLALVVAWLLVGWSLVDYLLEWQSRESRLKMSRDDLREEMKQNEGNPQIRGRIRRLQRQMRGRRVKEDVSKAAVVLTNPTHYAVALGFDFATMETPTVLAKGRNLLAEEIKNEARSAGVPIVEDPPLARSLYRSIEVGQPIPADLYAAVASILAYLYRQRVEAELRARRSRQPSTEMSGQAPQGGRQHDAARASSPDRRGHSD